MRVVVNSSPLIALERIGSLDVLKSLYGTVVRPQSVLDELGAGRSRYNFDRALFDTDWILTEPDPPEMVFRKELGAGETAAITLAYKTAADLVILDDPARAFGCHRSRAAHHRDAWRSHCRQQARGHQRPGEQRARPSGTWLPPIGRVD